MDVKLAVGKSGMMKKVLNQFGEPELADDLIDHWTNVSHADERMAMILRFQQLSLLKKVRITFIAGDVHCCGVGRLFNPDMDGDEHLMYQIVSSAIVNVPPPNGVLSTVNRSAKVYQLNRNTHEEMLDLFEKDVNGKAPATGKKLLGRRNWCAVTREAEALQFSIMVENQHHEHPSVPYSVLVPPMK
jgi:hypothetical protein